MQSLFLSIIIPTYRNTMTDIVRCLDSIYATSYQNFEVLLIDDGNEIVYQQELDQIEKQYDRLQVIHKSHAGVSAARNFGMQQAKGRYICFVDADDVVTKQFWQDVEVIISNVELQKDIIYGLVNGGRKRHVSVNYQPEILDDKSQHDLYRHFFCLGSASFWTKKGHIGRGPVARMVLRNYALKCPFDEELVHGEDMIWNLKILQYNPKLVVIRHLWYQVVGDPNSATRGYHSDFIDRQRKMLNVLKLYNQPGTESDFIEKIFESLKEIGESYFLSRKNVLPWREKVKEFNMMAYSYPFNTVLENNVKIGGVKPLIKLALYRAGLLLYVYKLKMILHR